MSENPQKAFQRVNDGKRADLLWSIGIPTIFHNASVEPKIAKKLLKYLNRKIEGWDSALVIVGKTLEDSYAAGCCLALMALEQGMHPSVSGFNALGNVYKSSFRDPSAKALLNSVLQYSDPWIIANINPGALGSVWGDARDLQWLQRNIHSRASLLRRTCFCIAEALSPQQWQFFIGADNRTMDDKATVIKLC